MAQENEGLKTISASATATTAGTDPFSGYKTVSEVNKMISSSFSKTPCFRDVMVKGEVVNYKGKGEHYYFSIKDDNAILSCIMWKNVAERVLNFKLKNGVKAAIIGNITFYGPFGTCSLIVDKIFDIGEGEAAVRLELLRKKLEDEGLFDLVHKNPVTKFPKKIGIVTSNHGMAKDDIAVEIRKRNPYVKLVLFNVRVQGAKAVETIVKGIQTLDKAGCDTIIVGRGGGSDEDLKAYNDERVVKAVFDARTPIVSAVGHTDNLTLTDRVADLYAGTPSLAATNTVEDVMGTLKELESLLRGIRVNMRNNLQKRFAALETQKAKLAGNDPRRKLKQNRDRVSSLSDSINYRIRLIFKERWNRCEVLTAKLNGLSPTSKLVKGFGYITRSDKPVTSVSEVSAGDEIGVRIHDGIITSKVTEIKKEQI